MATLSQQTNNGRISPLTFQLKTSWSDSTKEDKCICIDKAIEACSVICSIIAQIAGDELLQSVAQLPESVSNELVVLMQAYKNAHTKNLKTQILSLYAYRYPMKKLQKLHEPYERLTTWQIKRARAHAKECGLGNAVEKSSSHRVRLQRAKVDHFIDFVNRPYFLSGCGVWNAQTEA